jgi:streptogramin lyase
MKQEHGAATPAPTREDSLNHRRAHARRVAGLAVVLGIASVGMARAETAPIGVPDKSHPESVTSTRDGTLYVGSFNLGGVLKIDPDGKAEPLVKSGASGTRSTLGVLADERSGTLYVCSNDLSGLGVTGPSDTKGAWLKTFDLKTGAEKGSFALADPKSFCNDIVVGADGTAYVSDSFAPNIYSLKPGAAALDVWATHPLLCTCTEWGRPQRHRARLGRQSLRHHLHSGKAVQDRGEGRQGW